MSPQGMLRSRAYTSHMYPFKNATNTQRAPAPCQVLEQETNPLLPGVDSRVFAPHTLLKHLLPPPQTLRIKMQTTEELSQPGLGRQAGCLALP